MKIFLNFLSNALLVCSMHFRSSWRQGHSDQTVDLSSLWLARWCINSASSLWRIDFQVECKLQCVGIISKALKKLRPQVCRPLRCGGRCGGDAFEGRCRMKGAEPHPPTTFASGSAAGESSRRSRPQSTSAFYRTITSGGESYIRDKTESRAAIKALCQGG